MSTAEIQERHDDHAAGACNSPVCHEAAFSDRGVLLKRLEALEERYSWAIQLCDDNNMPPWKERYEAEIDKAIREDGNDQ